MYISFYLYIDMYHLGGGDVEKILRYMFTLTIHFHGDNKYHVMWYYSDMNSNEKI